MPRVKFTDVVDKNFGGVYVTPKYEVKKGDEQILSEKETKRLQKDHPGLIKVVDARARPEEDEEGSG